MLSFLPAPLLGVLALLGYSLNTLILGAGVFLIAPFKYVIPNQAWRSGCTEVMHQFTYLWLEVNAAILSLTADVEWDVQGVEGLKRRGWYLVISNHQAWADILVLDVVFKRRIPLLKFFMKKELIKLPMIGWLCWVMDFPFMERHSKSYLKKHPEQKGKDVETTRRACERFKRYPISIMTFVEGTRFTKEKQEQRKSPYQHLLAPKAGGLAFILAAMQDVLHTLLDVTIVYHNPPMTFWKFLCGRIGKITVRVQQRPITPEFIGDYQEDLAFRKQFQHIVNQMWHNKDVLIDQILKEDRPQ